MAWFGRSKDTNKRAEQTASVKLGRSAEKVKETLEAFAPKPSASASLSLAQDAVLARSGQAMQRVMSQLKEPSPTPAATPAPEDSGSASALLQKQSHQQKVQAALSPTDGTKGKSRTQLRGRGAPEMDL